MDFISFWVIEVRELITLEDFKKAKDMYMPRNMIMGHGVISRIAGVCDDLIIGRNVMIVTGNETYKAAGRDVEEILIDSKYDVTIIKTGNATMENVDFVADEAKKCGSDVLVSVGGGSKIDIGKLAAKKCGVHMISIPTCASHDGIASGRASIKSDRGSLSMDATVPLSVIADTEVIVKSPYKLMASGCADVISNMTAVMDWEFARRLRNEEFSSYAHSLALYSAHSVIKNSGMIRPNFEESVWMAVKPLVISGLSMSVAGSSRPTSGSEHMFSHALDIIAPGVALHGEQCGVGSIMMMYLHGGDWVTIRNALAAIGAPVDAKGLGVSREDIIQALTDAHKIRNDRFTILGDRGLTEDAAEAVAKNTGVI